MKFSFLERVIACSLLGATTVAVASGMHQVEPPKDGPDTRLWRIEDSVDETDDVIEESTNDDDDTVVEVPVGEEIREESIGKLVESVVSATGEEKEQKREALKSGLSKIFQKRIEIQKTRIAEMRTKLDSIEEQLDKRSSLEEQIVQRRTSELLGEVDELSWDAQPQIGANDQTIGEYSLRDLMHVAFANSQFGADKARQSVERQANQTKSFGDAQKQFAEAAKKAQNQAADVAKHMAEAERRLTESRARLDRRGVEVTSDLREKLGNAKEKDLVGVRAQERLNGLSEKIRDTIRKPDENQVRLLEARIEMMEAQKEHLRRELEVLSKQKK